MEVTKSDVFVHYSHASRISILIAMVIMHNGVYAK